MNRTLDLVFCDDPNEVKLLPTANLLKLDKLHPTLEVQILFERNNVPKMTPTTTEKMIFDFKNTKFDELILHLSQIDWSTIL